MTAKENEINGMDMAGFREYVEEVRLVPSKAERNPVIVAKWAGGSRARVEKDGTVIRMGGDDEPSAMWMFLASLAACDIEVVATHASLLGLEIESLEIEAKGHFDIRRLLGLNGPAPGYDGVTYTMRLRAPGATADQIARLRTVCEEASPVGNSFARAIPIELEIEAECAPLPSGGRRTIQLA